MTDALTWFEIPTDNLDRAQRFYETVLGIHLTDPGNTRDPMRIFPAPPPQVSGALVHRPKMHPGMTGTTVYLRLEGSVDASIDRVLAAGGSVIIPKTSVPGVPGEFFCCRDTEGNMVGIHGLASSAG